MDRCEFKPENVLLKGPKWWEMGMISSSGNGEERCGPCCTPERRIEYDEKEMGDDIVKAIWDIPNTGREMTKTTPGGISRLKTSILLVIVIVAASCKIPVRSSTPETGGNEGASTPGTTAVEKIPVDPLPEQFRGSWCLKKLWSPPHDSPHFWASASFEEKTFSVSEGEQSKDTGHWSIEGNYKVTGGSGTKEDPFVLTMTVVKGGGSDTHGYPADAGPAMAGEVIEGKVSLEDGRLGIQLPGTSQDLHRPPCDGKED